MSEYQVQVLQAQAQDKDRALAAREKLDRSRPTSPSTWGSSRSATASWRSSRAPCATCRGCCTAEVELSDAKVRLAEAAQQLDGERRRHAEREAHLLGREGGARRGRAPQVGPRRGRAARAGRRGGGAARSQRAAAERDELVEREREFVAVYDAKLRQWEDDARAARTSWGWR